MHLPAGSGMALRKGKHYDQQEREFLDRLWREGRLRGRGEPYSATLNWAASMLGRTPDGVAMLLHSVLTVRRATARVPASPTY